MALTAYQRMTRHIKNGSTPFLIQSRRDLIKLIDTSTNEDDKLGYRIAFSDIARELHGRGLRYCFSCVTWSADHTDGECEK